MPYDLCVRVVSALLGKDMKPGFSRSRFSAVGDVVSVRCACFAFSVVLLSGAWRFLVDVFVLPPSPLCCSFGLGCGFLLLFCMWAFRAHDTDELDGLK